MFLTVFKFATAGSIPHLQGTKYISVNNIIGKCEVNRNILLPDAGSKRNRIIVKISIILIRTKYFP